MDEKEMYESLIKWLKILELSGARSSAMDLSTGVTLGELLAVLVPNYTPKIRNISISDNWRSKASNLKKIVDSVVMYYSDELDLSLDEHLIPDVFKISENNDEAELIKLIKLLLGIAVNCENKLQYITQIMEMEEDIQRNIMKALQEIENIGTPSSTKNSMNVQNLDIRDDHEMLAQKLHEKENLISLMTEEKIAMQHEINKLQMAIEKYENQALIGEDGISLGAPLQGSVRMNELRKQIEILKNDLLLSETMKEDLKMKSMHQEKQISSLQMKIDELTKASSELSQIKDEVDILRDANEKAKEYERQLAIYKKKLEDNNDIKRQIKHLEERAAEYLKQNLTYEEELKKLSALKSQVDLYKNQLDEFHIKLDSEMQKTIKAEFDLQVIQTKLSGVTRERDNFRTECDNLRERLEELKCNNVTDDDDSTNISRELFGDNMKEKISRLEAENKALREGQQTALSDLLNDSNQRNEKLRDQLKSANQKILVLTSQNDMDKNKNGNLELRELCEQREKLLEEAQSQISNSHQRIRQLETSLETKTHDFAGLELKYKKCVEKAKEVIKGLGLSDGTVNEVPEEHEERMSIMESKLIVAAFYRMAISTQRENVDSKLASLTQGQSFMARQRQPAARKPITNYKK
ncbi:protein hook [Chironomus tepperi]|uniref:protein hook n=1 Tax=Chironomus tepperi TaxID=113505 RepID=UPI00391F6BD3